MTEEMEVELISMCNLSSGIYEKGIEKGIVKGMEKGIISIIKLCKEFNVSISDTVKRISSEFEVSETEAENKVKEYWK